MATLPTEEEKVISVTLTLHRKLALLRRFRDATAQERLDYIKQDVFKYNGLNDDCIIEAEMRHRKNESCSMQVDVDIKFRLNHGESEVVGFTRLVNELRDCPDISLTPDGLFDHIPSKRFGRKCKIRLMSLAFGTIIENKFIQHSQTVSSINADPFVAFHLDSQRTMDLYFLLANKLHSLELKYKRDIDNQIIVSWDNASTRIYFQLLLVPKIYAAEDGSYQYNPNMQQRMSTDISPEVYLKTEDDSIDVAWYRATEIPGCSSETFGLCTAVEITISDQSFGKDQFMSIFKELAERDYIITFGKVQRSQCNNYTRRWVNIFHFVNSMDSVAGFNICYALKVIYCKGYFAIDYIENHTMFWTKIKQFATENPEKLEMALYRLSQLIDEDRTIDLYKALCETYYSKAKTTVTEEEVKGICKVRSCYITPTRFVFFPPDDLLENRFLRQYDAEYCLRVSFRDDDFARINCNNPDFYDEVVRKQLSVGITIRDRKYDYLACSNSQLRAHGVWFYAKDSKNDTSSAIRDKLGDFSKIWSVAKFVARMGQCFSSSERTIEIKDFKEVEDIKTPDEMYTFSDGTGTISVSLAEKIVSPLKKNYSRTPSLFQIRYGGCKGTLSLDNTEKEDLVTIRKSMNKFACETHDMEIVKVASPSPLHLNHQSIMLLEYHGVPIKEFLKIQEKEISTILEMLLNEQTAAKLLDSRAHMGSPLSHKSLQECGLSLTTDPYFRRVLKLILHTSLSSIKTDGRIDLPQDKGRNLMGCMDEIEGGILEYGQVHVRITTDHKRNEMHTITGPIIVTKFPAVHPGDMRRFEAVAHPKLEHLVDCIVFPQKGHRPHPSEMAGSDLDGDEYFVTWLPEFLEHFSEENDEPLGYEPTREVSLGRPIVVTDIYQFISDYVKNDQLGVLANAHKAIADLQGLDSPVAVQLAEKFSVAVDFAKTGQCPRLDPEAGEEVQAFPDFMQKHGIKPEYESQRALGDMYRSVSMLDDLIEQSVDLKDDGVNWNQIKRPDEKMAGYDGLSFEEYYNTGLSVYREYCADVLELMTAFGVHTETEIMSGNITQFHRRFFEKEDKFATQYIVKQRVEELRALYRAKFFKEFHIDPNKTKIFPKTDGMKVKAYAWYHVAYYCTDATQGEKSDRYLSFPWLISDVLLEVCKMQESDTSAIPKCITTVNQSILKMYATHLTRISPNLPGQGNEKLDVLVDRYPAIFPLLVILDEWCRIFHLTNCFLSAVEILLRQLKLPDVVIDMDLLNAIKHYQQVLLPCDTDTISGHCSPIGQILVTYMVKVASQDFIKHMTKLKPISQSRMIDKMHNNAMRAYYALSVENNLQRLFYENTDSDEYMKSRGPAKRKKFVQKEVTVVVFGGLASEILNLEAQEVIISNFFRLAKKMDLYLTEVSFSSRRKRRRKHWSLFLRGSFRAVRVLRQVAIKWMKTFEAEEDHDYYGVLYNAYSEVHYY